MVNRDEFKKNNPKFNVNLDEPEKVSSYSLSNTKQGALDSLKELLRPLCSRSRLIAVKMEHKKELNKKSLVHTLEAIKFSAVWESVAVWQ